MNASHLQQIIDHYIGKFDELNAPGNTEYYKWQIIHSFRHMMDEALAAPDEAFPAKLYAVKKLTGNMIDSYTQPLNGLVEFSKHEPAAVRAMFAGLLKTAAAGVEQKQAAIQSFLDQSHRLRDRYYPDSYLYNDDLHSVTGYLFLYDPDHNYLYKATHCRSFADCVEFYDDWGSGENTRLDVFFRMCDEALSMIRNNAALMAVDAGRFAIDPEGMHPDTEKHILLFDLIYCCSTYRLFDGITYAVPGTGERHLMQERKEKARKLAEELEAAREELALLDQAKAYLNRAFPAGGKIRHKAFGEGTITENAGTTMTVLFPKAGQKTLGTLTCVVNGLIAAEDDEVQKRLLSYRDILRRDRQILSAVSRTERELRQYAEYLG